MEKSALEFYLGNMKFTLSRADVEDAIQRWKIEHPDLDANQHMTPQEFADLVMENLISSAQVVAEISE